MKVKKLFLFAAAAALFAACSSDELPQQTAQQTPQDNGAINFAAYMQRSVTRAGVSGEANLTALQTGSMKEAGFGVFAYYTDNFDYTPLYQPNFMYNEQVTYSSGTFGYEVTKYWPNEHGSAATSADMDRVSFFAYLPYVKTDPATGMLVDESSNVIPGDDPKMQYGITGMKRNSLQGDPTIQYVASFDLAHCVDLCWGINNADLSWKTNGSTQTIKGGYPWLNVRKPDGIVGSDSKVNFTFRHALAQLGVNVQTDFTGGWNETDATKTKVWVRSIRFTGIAQKAALNLNNPKANTARWIDYYGTNEMEMGESVTVYDGRKDGSEGVEGAEAINEAVLGLNPQIVQTEGQIDAAGVWKSGAAPVQPGVTTTPVKLFRDGDDPADFVYVIPTGEKVNVEIVYDIETIDPKLPTTLSDGETHGSTIENRIIKQAVFNKLESGKSYVLNLKLGMKDVQFDASEFSDWVDGETSDAYLPNNMAPISGGAGSSEPVITIPVPYNVTNLGNLTISGLTANADYSGKVTKDATIVKGATGSTADASGNMIISGITLDVANTTVKKQQGWIKVDADGSQQTVINIERAAKPFVHGLTAIEAGSSFKITANNTNSGTVESTQWADAVSTVVIKKYDTDHWVNLVIVTDYTLSAETDGITVNMTTHADEQYKVSVKVGDSPAVETPPITVTTP